VKARGSIKAGVVALIQVRSGMVRFVMACSALAFLGQGPFRYGTTIVRARRPIDAAVVASKNHGPVRYDTLR
jgi:hypothetical protein